MKDILPCPYCGGEVEMVKLRDKQKRNVFRINCMQCKVTVPVGIKFEKESDEDGQKRVQQYEEHIDRVWSPIHSTRIKQKSDAKSRDYWMSMSSRISMDDEVNEIHDVSHRIAR